MIPEVDTFLSNSATWKSELEKLRAILLDCQLTETLKWRTPCYMYQNSNVALIGQFKNYCAISFFKGALLSDPNQMLDWPGENSQSAKLIKFTSIEEIAERESIIKSLIHQAIEIEKAGLKVEVNKEALLIFIEELQNKIEEDALFKSAFEALTPGRQRGYNIYFSAPKNSKSRVARIEKYESKILSGKGINDCTCGHSKRMPSCDGSHKYL